jgi:pilus retraction protein PilT
MSTPNPAPQPAPQPAPRPQASAIPLKSIPLGGATTPGQRAQAPSPAVAPAANLGHAAAIPLDLGAPSAAAPAPTPAAAPRPPVASATADSASAPVAPAVPATAPKSSPLASVLSTPLPFSRPTPRAPEGGSSASTQPSSVPQSHVPPAPANPGKVLPGPGSQAGVGSATSFTPANQVPGAAAAAASGPALSPRHVFESWIAAMVESKASDLILRAGGRPCCRIDGKISFLNGRVPNAGPMTELLEGVLGKRAMAEWREHGSADTALALDGLGRFRVNAYRQMGEPALVLRRINSEAPELEKLFLPAAELKRLSLRKRGLILVTGIAGSGKSTTLAGMIQYMNRHAERHVVTLEDPVELIFAEDRCVISQREVGIDCQTFSQGLRHSLRQSPDVILIGEMRDSETVSAALDATETGHLVMSTLHTVNAAQTLDRVLGFFPAEQHRQVCIRLAENLAGVLSQRLVPRSQGKGMVPACELMTPTPRVRELLEKGQTIEVARAIDQGAENGLISFNQSLRSLVEQGLVEVDVALAASDRPEELMLALRGFSNGSTGGRGNKLRMSGGE